MSVKSKITWTLAICLAVFIVFLGLIVALFFYLPTYLETRIIPQLAEDTGISNFAGDVREIGLYGADVGGLRIGNPANPALLIRSIQIDYSPQGLYQQKLKRIVASGVELYCAYQNGQFSLRGLDLNEVLAKHKTRKKEKSEAKKSLPVIPIERVEIRNAVVIVELNGRQFRVPLEMEVSPEDPAKSILDVFVHLYPRGQKISATTRVDLNRSNAVLDFNADALHLGRFADLIRLIPELSIFAIADIQGHAELDFAALKISSLAVSVNLPEYDVIYQSIRLQNLPLTKKENLPLRLSIKQTDDMQWKITGSELSMVSPVRSHLTEVSATVKRVPDVIQSSGHFSFVVAPADNGKIPPTPFRVVESIPFDGKFSFDYSKTGSWQMQIANREGQKNMQDAKFYFNGVNFNSKIPVININGKGTKTNIGLTYEATVPDIDIRTQAAVVRIPAVSIKGKAEVKNDGEGRQVTNFTLQSPDTRVKLDSAEIKIPQASFSGEVRKDPEKDLRLDGTLRFAKAGVSLSEMKARMIGAQGTIPLSWPPVNQNKPGSISIAGLRYRNWDMGSIRSTVRQTESGISFQGEHRNPLIPALSLAFSGQSELVNSKDYPTAIRFELLQPNRVADISLDKFVPTAKGITLSGIFALEGNLMISTSKFSGFINSNLSNAKLLMPQNKMAIEGLQLQLSFPDLPNIRSAPAQQIAFAKASFGGLEIEKGRMEFQIESARSFLIEKSQFSWCNGKVDTQAMRISPGVEDYSLILYCDRLNLAKVLQQFGAVNAEGKGTVNGRIPVRYRNGKLSFDDGFLFSSPGEGGKVRLTGTEILTAGIPPNTTQYVQMELAAAALKDYDYSWAKLHINTDKEELLLRVQFDGKPANPLPFVYKKEIGGFAKVEAGSPGSRFQGISLDVNFRLPLNKLLQYKDIIKMIQ